MDAIDKDVIIGGLTSSGEYSGLKAIDLLYTRENQVANLLGIPGWSDVPEVYAKMITYTTKINGHWNGQGNGRIQVSVPKATTIKTQAD